ncbi:MAG: cell division protein FtsQ/DivIB, partial [Actinomycetota bacterium]
MTTSTTAASARLGTDPRISRRRRAVAREHRRRLFLRAAVIAALAMLAWVLVWSPLLKVRDVRVVGGGHTNGKRAARVADLDAADNLLLVSPATVEQRVETLPWVMDAEVDRMLPDTVRIRLRERRPALALAVGGRRWLLD